MIGAAEADARPPREASPRREATPLAPTSRAWCINQLADDLVMGRARAPGSIETRCGRLQRRLDEHCGNLGRVGPTESFGVIGTRRE
jgi:hypothetical protein